MDSRRHIKQLIPSGFQLVLIGALLVSGIIYSSCRHEPENLEALPEVCFDTEILPIFQTNCAISGCHNSASRAEGKVFDSYANIMAGGIEPYEPTKSKAYQVMHAEYGNLMPPSGPLSIEQRTLIRVWILQGAIETKCDTTGGGNTGGDTNTVCFTNDVLPILQTNCAKSGCHDSNTKEEGYDFSSYTTTMATNTVTKGSPNTSKLYKVLIASSNSDDFMPPSPNTPLTQSQIQTISTWIAEGATNDQCAQTCNDALFSFSGQIKPIIDTYCKGCHGGSNPQNGLSLETFAQVKAIADNGKLVGSIKGLQGFTKMPSGSSLSACQISQIEQWVLTGAPND